MTELNETQKNALLRLAELAPRYRTGTVSTPNFGFASTARALERRGLVRGRTFPVEGYQLTDAGREVVDSLQADAAFEQMVETEYEAYYVAGSSSVQGEEQT